MRYSLVAAVAGAVLALPVRDTAAAPSAKVADAAKACARDWNAPPSVVREQPKRRLFSIDGYLERNLAIELGSETAREPHCVRVAWPPSSRNADGGASAVADRVNEAWLRVIKNTLARVPRAHARLVQRIVIDNRPREHGIAPHDRARDDDARDGRTIWLHEHVFLAPNHWARGNYGSYWSYHVNQDGLTIDGTEPEHTLFSPVLLHELGHLVMYRLVNARFKGPAATSAPACAEANAKTTGQGPRALAELEAGCVSPYCRSFQFDARTENWAEQYRFYFQSSAARDALARSRASCLPLLQQLEPAPSPAPWQRGLPDSNAFRKSRWQSCNGRSCKAW